MRWKLIPGFPEYEVSDQGNVRRVTAGKGARAGYVLTPLSNGRGYHQVKLCVNGKRHPRTIHRLVLEAFNGAPPSNDHVCNHKNGVKTDNRLANLEWATWDENAQHAVNTGLRKTARGETKSNLTEANVRDMRRRVAGGESRAAVSRDFGITPNQVGRIVARKSWAHVE